MRLDIGIGLGSWSPPGEAVVTAVYMLVPPAIHSAAFSGDVVDLQGAGTSCFAAQQVGVFEEDHTWTGVVEESANGTTGWATVATFAAVTEGQQAEVKSFTRTQRYLRYTATCPQADPEVNLAVLLGTLD